MKTSRANEIRRLVAFEEGVEMENITRREPHKVIYFVRGEVVRNMVKIGMTTYTRDKQRIMNEIQPGNADILHIINLIGPVKKGAEGWYHDYFKSKGLHVRHEWYTYSTEMEGGYTVSILPRHYFPDTE